MSWYKPTRKNTSLVTITAVTITLLAFQGPAIRESYDLEIGNKRHVTKLMFWSLNIINILQNFTVLVKLAQL